MFGSTDWQWKYLVMFSYEVEPELLKSYLPRFTEPDLYNGKALISIVSFLFTQTRQFNIRWPFHKNFDRTNLCIYVKHNTGNGYRRGVVFISEFAPQPVTATLANLLYHEKYSAEPMLQHMKFGKELITASYLWKHKQRWNRIYVEAETNFGEIEPGTLEEFVLPYNWGYSSYNNDTTIEFRVEYKAEEVYKVTSWQLDCDIAAVYGKHFENILNQQPLSVLLVKGSKVVIQLPHFINDDKPS